MAQEFAASVAASVIRLTRLDASGAPLTGPDNSYTTTSFISVSMTPEYEEGEEFIQKNAAGETCIIKQSPNTLKRVNLSVAICNPDPYFTEMISGGELLGLEGDGWAAPETGKNATPNGVGIEVWSNAVVDGQQATGKPYFHWLFPYAILQPGGDRVIENGILATSFEGWGKGNAAFGDGPAAPLWPYPDLTNRAYAYVRSTDIPAGTGYQEVVADVAGV